MHAVACVNMYKIVYNGFNTIPIYKQNVEHYLWALQHAHHNRKITA